MAIGRHSRRMSYSNREESFFPTASVRGAEGPSCMTGFSAEFAASSCQPLSFLSGGGSMIPDFVTPKDREDTWLVL